MCIYIYHLYHLRPVYSRKPSCFCNCLFTLEAVPSLSVSWVNPSLHALRENSRLRSVPSAATYNGIEHHHSKYN